MRVQAEPSDIFVILDGIECRVWNAVTEEGQQVFLFVHRVATRAMLEELIEMPDPFAAAADPTQLVLFGDSISGVSESTMAGEGLSTEKFYPSPVDGQGIGQESADLVPDVPHGESGMTTARGAPGSPYPIDIVGLRRRGTCRKNNSEMS